MPSERSESYFFFGILVLAALLMVLVFLPELDAIVVGSTLAVLLEPWFIAIRRRFRGNGGAAAGIVVLLAIAFILVPVVFFGIEVFIEAQGLYGSIAGGGGVPAAAAIHSLLARIAPSVKISLSAYAQQLLAALLNDVGPLFSQFLGVLATFFLSFFALYYFLKDGDGLRAAVMRWSPLPADRTDEVLGRLHAVMSAVVRGALLIGVVYGVLTGIGFAVFGLPSAILWGGVTVIASFVPWIGVFLVAGPGIAALALGGHMFAALGFAVWYFVMTSVVESWLRPWIVGRRAQIHPLLMLFAVLGGLAFFGPIGFLLGPLALGLFLALLDSYPLFALNNLNRKLERIPTPRRIRMMMSGLETNAEMPSTVPQRTRYQTKFPASVRRMVVRSGRPIHAPRNPFT